MALTAADARSIALALPGVVEHPDACVPVHWGRKLAAVGVLYAKASRGLVVSLLEDAWESKRGGR